MSAFCDRFILFIQEFVKRKVANFYPPPNSNSNYIFYSALQMYAYKKTSILFLDFIR